MFYAGEIKIADCYSSHKFIVLSDQFHLRLGGQYFFRTMFLDELKWKVASRKMLAVLTFSNRQH
jgi:hypothetical protein